MPPLFNLLKILGRLAWMTKFGIHQNLALFPPSLFPHKKFPCGEGSIIRRGSWWFANYQSRAQNFYDPEFATCIAWNKVEEISKQRNEERWSEKCGNYILYSVAHVEAWKGLDASIKRHNLHFSLIFFLLIFCWVNTRLARAIRGPVSSKSRNAEKTSRKVSESSLKKVARIKGLITIPGCTLHPYFNEGLNPRSFFVLKMCPYAKGWSML